MVEKNAPYEQMRASLKDWVELPEPQWSNLKSIFHLRVARKQEHIIWPGSKAYQVLFVYHGLLRTYYLTEEGAESNKSFATENMFGGPTSAFILGLPIAFGVQALERSTLLIAKYADFAALFDQHPIFDRLGRKLAEQTLIRKEIRERSFLLKDAKERYREFLEHYPDLVQRLPQYHIASYLGISEVSLSRLKRSLAEDTS